MSPLPLTLALLVLLAAKETQSLADVDSTGLRCSNANYLQLGSKCYKTFLVPKKTYVEAKRMCQTGGGRLALMSTSEEAIAVLTSMHMASNWQTLRRTEKVWIGMHARANENAYEWEDGQLVAGTIDLFGLR
ncbi:hypothetical protein CAPTEDRAFT_194028 [Capitella teleta]|uniref:C-type lectin domain-containing protein n=1 Tax=Capitella teleta TaxID=283909 RepID=R7V427_CAPTE|nr:hypothetical protein CAPTEDRAFT_194028 [Capitella teleta]|eukprot:ELU10560.1 hypothetical protein CAPTEDRAFT_194028 [Capitella teleta]